MEKDLRQMKANEIKIGGHFYKKVKGGYERCCIHKEEVKSEINAKRLRDETIRLAGLGLLYVRVNRPFESFEG